MRFRISQPDTADQQLIGHVALMHALQFRQLHLAVDPQHFPFVIGVRGAHGHSLGDRQGNDIGQIIFTLGVVIRQPGQPVGEAGRGNRHDAGIDLANRLLRGARILLFDDPLHVPGSIANDTSVAGRVGQFHGQDRQAILARMQQTLQGGGLGQRHVAIENQRLSRAVQDGQRLGKRMPGTQLRLLHGPRNIGRIEGRPHHFAAMAENHDQPDWSERTRGIDHMLGQRLAGDRVQHLGQIGMHPLALTGGEDDDLYRHFSHIRTPETTKTAAGAAFALSHDALRS